MGFSRGSPGASPLPRSPRTPAVRSPTRPATSWSPSKAIGGCRDVQRQRRPHLPALQPDRHLLSGPRYDPPRCRRAGDEPDEELIDYLAPLRRAHRRRARPGAGRDGRDADGADAGRADQGALIELLVRLIGAKDALEVGTFTGYSAICIARGLAEGGRLTCLELDEERAAIARRTSTTPASRDRVEIRVGPAGESLEAMAAAPAFDFAFIDADKAGYPEYYELVLARMRHGGLILLDNMLQGGRVLDARDRERAGRSTSSTARIHEDERVDMAMTISADGLTFVARALSGYAAAASGSRRAKRRASPSSGRPR